MDLDLFGAFHSGEGVDEVAPPSTAAEESRKRLLDSDDLGVGVDSKLLKKNDTEDDGSANAASGKITHTEERKIEWSGRSVLTSSALPEGFADLSGDKDMNTMPTNPAKVYPFELDPFQKQSIAYIERNESVLVAAHTSAGKTVVAEYAVARSIKAGQRVIYTSPIKALSNQKFRDMQEEFGVDQVGLMTGDITINPTATCLIMTTEILRSMLYRGSEVMREVAWVIYDEIHYMRDKERGVVWEESIILLPHKVRFVFLSATIPNAREFVGWIAGLHHQPCHVVYTDYRPTPLQHYIFPAGGEGLHLVVDDKGVFREDAFQHAMAKLQASTKEEAIVLGETKTKRKKQPNGEGPSDLTKIIKLVMDRDFDPVIVFSFAKRECETYAMLMSKQDFNTEDEKELVGEVFNNAIDALSDDDKTLPQVESLLPILKRGIGIHHGGLLPILKEVIEILFQEGLLKVLFATETFSIGLNMPAHTVIFTACRKFDGKDFRWITAGEYIQMAGRAGRRGKDTNGIVIQMLDEKMEPQVAKGILYGQPDELYSSYHVSYNMLLNMLRVEGADPTFLVKSSFHQYQQEKGAPALDLEADEMAEIRNGIVIKDEDLVKDYHTIYQQLEVMDNDIRTVKMLPENVIAFLQAGRLVHIAYTDDKNEVLDFGWGAVVDFRTSKKMVNGVPSDATLEVILSCLSEEKAPTPPSKKSDDEEVASCEMRVVKVSLKSLKDLSTIRIFLPKDLKSTESRQSVSKTLGEVKRRLGVIPSLDPVTDMKVMGVSGILDKKLTLEERLQALPFHNAVDKQLRLAEYAKKHELGEKIKLLRKTSKQAQAPVMRDTMKRMQRVLKRLGHVKADGVIDTKGRVACEVNTADELVVTELVFGGLFVNLGDAETSALLSCLVFQERRKDDEGAPKLRDTLTAPYRQLQDTIRSIAAVCVECKMELEVEEYLATFNPDLMEVVYAWSNGARFIDIIKLTTCYEGTVIRVIRRLEELLRQLASSSFVIGNNVLKEKFERCAASMRRDIVFAASLYL